MTSSSGARSVSAASTASNRRWRAPASSAAPRLERVGGAGLAERVGERLERRERLLRAAAEQDGGAVGECGGGELVGEPGLADAGLAGEQHEPAVAVHLHAGPRRAQALELGAAADERGRVGALERARRRDRRCRRAPQLVEQRARLARRRDAERAAQALGEPLAGGQRGGAVAAPPRAARSGGGSAPRRAGRARPARASGGSPRRARPSLASCSSASASRCACAWRASWAQSSSKPSRIGPRLAASAAAASPASSAAANARVSTAPSSATVSRPATSWSAAGPSARRSSVSAARRLVRADSSSTSGQKRAASWARACGPGCSAR